MLGVLSLTSVGTEFCSLDPKARHWHKVYSSPTSHGFVKNKSCQTNLIFLWRGSRSQRGEKLEMWYILTAVRLLTLFRLAFPGARWGNTVEEKCCEVPNWLGKHTEKLWAVYCRSGRMAWVRHCRGLCRGCYYSIFSLVTWVMEYGVDLLHLLTIPSWEGLQVLSENGERFKNLNKLKKQAGKKRLTFEKDKGKAECTRTIETYVRKWLRRQHF